MTTQPPHSQYAAVKTGDILLFAGWNCAALVLRVGTQSEYTHAGIAVWLATADGPRLHCFEAGPCPLPDALSGRLRAGCRLVDIDHVMRFYTKLAVRKVRVPRDASFHAKLRDLIAEYRHKTFRSMFRLAVMNAGLVGPPRDAEDSSVFCSELCSTWLGRIGALKEPILRDVPHHRASPAAFSHSFVYPDDAFDGRSQVVHDEGTDQPVRDALAVTLFLGLCTYAAVTLGYTRSPE